LIYTWHVTICNESCWTPDITYAEFLGALAKLRNATIAVAMSVPSVRMAQLDPHWKDFQEI